MPAVYDVELKGDRLAAVRDRLNGGTLEIGTAGFEEVVARIRLATPCAEVHGDELVFDDMPQRSIAIASGRAQEARCVDVNGVVRVSGLTVAGEDDEKADDADVKISPDADVKAGQAIELMDFRIIHG